MSLVHRITSSTAGLPPPQHTLSLAQNDRVPQETLAEYRLHLLAWCAMGLAILYLSRQSLGSPFGMMCCAPTSQLGSRVKTSSLGLGLVPGISPSFAPLPM